MFRALALTLALLLLGGCASSTPLSERNRTLLRSAALGRTETVRTMLDNGAEIDCRDRLRDSPLHLAIRNGHTETVALLFARGANVNQGNTLGDTPLHVSVYTSQPDLARQLRSKGASDEALNQYGLNPGDMESLPETEAAVAEMAALLSFNGNWIDAKTARPGFDELKRRDQRFLINALILQIIQSSPNPDYQVLGRFRRRTPDVSSKSRLQTIFLSIKLGIPGSEDLLGAILMVYGDQGMAEDYLNSGSGELHAWASRWAEAKGYKVRAGTGSHRANWGIFQTVQSNRSGEPALSISGWNRSVRQPAGSGVDSGPTE